MIRNKRFYFWHLARKASPQLPVGGGAGVVVAGTPWYRGTSLIRKWPVVAGAPAPPPRANPAPGVAGAVQGYLAHKKPSPPYPVVVFAGTPAVVFAGTPVVVFAGAGVPASAPLAPRAPLGVASRARGGRAGTGTGSGALEPFRAISLELFRASSAWRPWSGAPCL